MARQRICSEADIPPGEMKRFKVGRESVLIYHIANGFYATQTNCTHTFGPLRMGKLVDGCKIQCPIHGAQFDVRSGEVVRWANFPPGIQLLNFLRSEKALRTYDVTVEGGQLFVDV